MSHATKSMFYMYIIYIYNLWRFRKDITYIRSHKLLVDTILSSALRPYDDSRYYEIWVIRWNFTTKLGVKPNESGPQDVLKSFLDDKSQLQQKIPTDFFLLENSKWIPELFGHFFVFGKILQGPWFSWKIPKFYSKLPTAFSTTPGWCEKAVRSGSSHRSTGGQFHGMAGVRSMGGWVFRAFPNQNLPQLMFWKIFGSFFGAYPAYLENNHINILLRDL